MTTIKTLLVTTIKVVEERILIPALVLVFIVVFVVKYRRFVKSEKSKTL